MPGDWTWEKFKVIDGHDGTIALWNPGYMKFVRMPDSSNTCVDKSHTRDDGTLPSGWLWERFKVVHAGNGYISLWNPKNKRFVSMTTGGTTGTPLGKSDFRGDGTLPSNSSPYRFKVVCITGCSTGCSPPTSPSPFLPLTLSPAPTPPHPREFSTSELMQSKAKSDEEMALLTRLFEVCCND